MKETEISQTIALVANGDISDYSIIKPLIAKHSKVIAVDGGLIHCHNMGIMPDLIIGDFDSTPKELLEHYSHIPQEKFPRDKDHSDLELAISAADPSTAKSVVLFGSLGKRMDHALYNIQLMCRYPSKISIQTEVEKMVAVEGSKKIQTREGQTVSLIPVTTGAVTVTTKGLKWELTGTTLSYQWMSLSNIALGDTIDIHVDKGILVCSLMQ